MIISRTKSLRVEVFDSGLSLTRWLVDNGAELTIIAASGSDPTYGLPGVSRSRQSLPTLNVGNHTFVAIEEPKAEIETTHWNTRAWTYQEALLSRRRLVFTNTQLYYQCRAGHFVEGLDYTGVKDQRREDYQAFPNRGVGGAVTEVFDRLEEYYKRDVSYDIDIINAFMGIFQAFRNTASLTQAHHFYGIPIFCRKQFSDFDDDMALLELNVSFTLGLAWKVVGCQYYIDHSETTPCTVANFPSWSWAGFKARQPKADRGRLEYGHRRYQYHSFLDYAINVSICHRSGSDMDLLTYLRHSDDYTAFRPVVFVKSMIIQGSLVKGDRDLITFSACPTIHPQCLHLHEDPESLLGPMTVMYAGHVQHRDHGYHFVFLMLKKMGDGQYRRVGVLSDSVPFDDVDMSSSDWSATLHRVCGSHRQSNWQHDTVELM